MALESIDNQASVALPAERQRGLVFGYYDELDGASDYYQSPGDSRVVGDFSAVVMARLLFDQDTDANNRTLIDGGDAGNRFVIERQNTGGLVVVYQGTAATLTKSQLDALLISGFNWFGFSYDSTGSLKIYVNGSLAKTTAVAGSKELVEVKPTIGANYTGSSGGGFYVERVALYSSVLSDAEFADIANNATYDYLSRASIVFPMDMSRHKGTYAEALDGTQWAINGATKLSTRGYAFDETVPSSISVDSLTVDGPFSMAVLFRKTNLNDQDYLFDSTGTRMGTLFYSDNRLQAVIGGNGTLQLTEGDWVDHYSPNGWNVYILSHDGTNAIMHMNGVKILDDPDAVSFPFTTGTFYLGRYNANTSFALEGSEAWFGLLPLLTPTQIIDLTQRLLASVNEV
jgi:hypothetical protein